MLNTTNYCKLVRMLVGEKHQKGRNNILGMGGVGAHNDIEMHISGFITLDEHGYIISGQARQLNRD